MGIQLPESEKLNIEDLQRIFDDKSECYKLFWFKAILKKVKDGKQNITYGRCIRGVIGNLRSKGTFNR